MRFLRFILAVIKEAWSESLDWAQAVVFCILIIIGGTINVLPDFAKIHDLQHILDFVLSAKGALWAFGSAIGARLILAPYYIWSRENTARVLAEKESEEIKNRYHSISHQQPHGRLITSGDHYAVTDTDNIIVIDKEQGSETNIFLPINPRQSHNIEIKDGKGDASRNHIVINGNGRKIDGLETLRICFNRQSYSLIYLGDSWRIT